MRYSNIHQIPDKILLNASQLPPLANIYTLLIIACTTQDFIDSVSSTKFQFYAQEIVLTKENKQPTKQHFNPSRQQLTNGLQSLSDKVQVTVVISH
jgi:hypothetical protein